MSLRATELLSLTIVSRVTEAKEERMPCKQDKERHHLTVRRAGAGATEGESGRLDSDTRGGSTVLHILRLSRLLD